MVLAPLAAMPLIDQHDNVRAVIAAFRQFGRAVELLDQRENNPLIATTYLLSQPFARGGHCRFAVLFTRQLTTGGKGLAQLAFQIDPIGHHDNPAGFQ